MTSLYNHLSWFIFLVSFLLISLSVSLFISFFGESLYLSFPLFNTSTLDLSVSFRFDYISSWFFSTVLLISTVVMVYSYNYISPYSKSLYFLWLTILFVLSMLIVISMNNLFFLMLGWDGLGLISFFLIVYYQNQSCLTSGFFTLLINRIGDSFFLASIVLFFYSSSDLSVLTRLPNSLVISFLLLTFMTKRALFPFSPWLPAAMAAPTPISALVHSSTLVTSGLFLMMRFSYVFYSSSSLISILVVVRIFTSFYAGLNTIFEKDLKKLIALSTLRHLGFIGLAYSSGLLNLAFFHILTHALFKSLLFITIGDIIINLNHSQDIRHLSSGFSSTPFSSFVMNVSLLNLLGLPSLRGFFSKDLVLEDFSYSRYSFLLVTLLYLNVFFTYYYTYSLLNFSFSSLKFFPYQLFHSPLLIHSLLLLLLSLFAVTFGSFFLSHICSFCSFLVVPISIKFLPISINFLFFLLLFLFTALFTSSNVFINNYFSQIMFLTPFIMTLSSKFFCHFTSSFTKTFESGVFYHTFNSYPSSMLSSLSLSLYKQSTHSPLSLSLYSSFVFLLFLL